MKGKNLIPVFVSVDETTVPQLKRLMASILSNTDEKVCFYILNKSLDEKLKNEIKVFFREYSNLSIEFCNLTEEIFEKFQFPDNGIQFIIPEIKPEIQKALYFDNNIVVNSNIKELYDIDLENYPLACSIDYKMWYDKKNIIRSFYLDIDHKKYFATSVLLLNLEYFKKQDIKKKALEIYNSKKELIEQSQDVFNILFKDNYKKLDVKYNYNFEYENFYEKYSNPALKCDLIKIKSLPPPPSQKQKQKNIFFLHLVFLLLKSQRMN